MSGEINREFQAKAVYPGSFDPITISHWNLALRGTRQFEHVDFLVAANLDKTPWFSLEERASLIQDIIQNSGTENIGVKILEKGLAVNFAAENGYTHMLRGVRDAEDAANEYKLFRYNYDLNEDIETTVLFSPPSESIVSSSYVKQLVRIGEGAERYVHPIVLQALGERATRLF